MSACRPFPAGRSRACHFSDVLTAPLAQTFTWFDFTLNALSYLPLGFLLAYVLRNRWPAAHLLLLTTLAGLSLSVAMEYTQMYLPSRVSSNTDLLSNSMGTLAGSAFALTIAKHEWYSLMAVWHDRWLKQGRLSDFGLALVALWVFAQTNPSLPMLGSVFVSEVARWPFDIVPAAPFNWLECAEVALNLLLLGILLSTLLRERRHTLNGLLLVLCTVTLIKFIAAAVLLKSWALLLWLNSEALLGIMAGVLLLTAALRLSRSWLLGVGALAAVIYLMLVLDLLLEQQTLCRHAPVPLALHPHAQLQRLFTTRYFAVPRPAAGLSLAYRHVAKVVKCGLRFVRRSTLTWFPHP